MKIGRAERHFREFDALIVDYCTSNAYDRQDREEGGRYFVTLTPRPFAGDIPLSLADGVYALRSGLDQLAWQLSLLETTHPSRETMFPIFGERTQRNEELFRKRVRDMPCEAAKAIKRVQPYHRGDRYMDDPLWQLNELSNLDKHRLPAVRSHEAEFTVSPEGFERRDLTFGTEFSWPQEQKPLVNVAARTPRLFFGDPILEAPDPFRPVLEIDRFQVAEIYRYVREEIASTFDQFLT